MPDITELRRRRGNCRHEEGKNRHAQTPTVFREDMLGKQWARSERRVQNADPEPKGREARGIEDLMIARRENVVGCQNPCWRKLAIDRNIETLVHIEFVSSKFVCDRFFFFFNFLRFRQIVHTFIISIIFENHYLKNTFYYLKNRIKIVIFDLMFSFLYST